LSAAPAAAVAINSARCLKSDEKMECCTLPAFMVIMFAALGSWLHEQHRVAHVFLKVRPPSASVEGGRTRVFRTTVAEANAAPALPAGTAGPALQCWPLITQRDCSINNYRFQIIIVALMLPAGSVPPQSSWQAAKATSCGCAASHILRIIK